MKHHKYFELFIFLTATVCLILDTLSPQAANAGFRRLECGSFVAGSYAVTITNENTGEIVSRTRITFFSDRNMSVEDSAEKGGASDFRDQQGTWKCTGRRESTATTFGLGPPDTGMARWDYVAVFAGQGARAQKVKGTIEQNLFFDPLADPFSDNADRVRKFSFIGQRLAAD